MSFNKYNFSKVYAVYCPTSDDELLYVGSTTKKYLCSRLAEHKANFKQFLAGRVVGKSSCFEIFNKYGVENCKIKLLEHVNCETHEELASREAYHIRNNICVNKQVPHRTRKEYYQDNKEMLIEYQRIYNFRKRLLKQLAIELVLMNTH